MNLSTIALLLLVWQLLGTKSTSQSQSAVKKPDLTQLFSDDTKSMIDCVGKLSSQKSTNDDKMGALFQIISNPTVMNLVQNLFPQKDGTKTDTPQEATAQQNEFTNDEGYRFETPSTESQEFFRPIDNIADAEVKNKLYWFYDNWYIK